MESGHDSRFWDEIVGKHWPAIPPSDLHRLQSIARDAAENTDPEEADRARRLFSDRVRVSRGLQPAKDDMAAQVGSLRSMVDALVVASDVFGLLGDLAYRTRHRILDIVERADADIERVRQEQSDADSAEEREEAEADRERRISALVREARDDVADVERNALTMLGPHGLPELATLAELLGQPNPWAPSGGAGSSPGRRSPSTGGPGAGGPPHPVGAPALPHGPDGRLVSGPLLPGLIRLDPGLFPHSPLPFGDLTERFRDALFGVPAEDRIPLVQPPASTAPSSPPEVSGGAGPDVHGGPAPQNGAGWAPATPGPTQSPPRVVGIAPAGGGEHPDELDGAASAERQEPQAHRDDRPELDGTAGNRSEPVAGDDDDRTGTDSEPGAAHLVRTARDDAEFDEEFPGTDSGESGSSPVAMATTDAGEAAPTPIPLAPPAPGVPAVSAPADRMNAPATQVNAPTGAAGAGAEPRAPSPPDTRAATAAGKGPLVGQPPGASVTAPAKAQSPLPLPDADRSAGPDGERDPADTVRDAVGAAMVAASAPAFVVGERVDGDLVLARSLLSSLLAAVGDSALGVDWAVAILRHSGGLTAFVTSNEGRGWLPAGLYLPRELSTPWVWSESENSGWEGVADPARVLVEFGLVWGTKVGARLAALVSSRPIDATLAAQLGPVAVAGETGPDPVMDFGSAAPGSVDRLELVGAAPLIDRVAATPPDRIAERCLALARDAHTRAAAAPDALGVAAIRDAVLRTIAQRQPVPEQLWEELRDADAVVAASILPLRSDVSRVALGELRSETGSGRRGEAAALRALVCQRRCDELVLLLAAAPTRQLLRDAVYALAQLLELGPPSAGPDGAGPPPRVSSVSTGPRR